MLLQDRQRKILQSLLQAGKLSRSELHIATGIRKNTICDDTAELLQSGILCERDALRAQRGRPRTPLEIDPIRRHVLGLSIRPGHVEIGRLNLLGQPMDEPTRRSIKQPSGLIAAAAELLKGRLNKQTFSVGISSPGLIDTTHRQLLISSALPESGTVTLAPLFEASGKVPVILENDMHAIAACWLLTHRQDAARDTLLVYLDDGQLGSSLLIDGRPNRGCVHGANELGHTRLSVETPRCFCGQPGCLEVICSTRFYQQLSNSTLTLPQAITASPNITTDPALQRIISLLGMGVANALNFTRVDDLVLMGPLCQYENFVRALIESIREQTLGELAKHMQLRLWSETQARTAQNAGWLALANLFYEGWDLTTHDEAAGA